MQVQVGEAHFVERETHPEPQGGESRQNPRDWADQETKAICMKPSTQIVLEGQMGEQTEHNQCIIAIDFLSSKI